MSEAILSEAEDYVLWIILRETIKQPEKGDEVGVSLKYLNRCIKEDLGIQT